MRITIDKLNKRPDAVQALRDLSPQTEDGELLVLLGPSGEG